MKTNGSDWAVRSLVAVAATLAFGATQAQAPRVVLDGPASAVVAGDVFSVTLSGHDFMPIVGGGVDLNFSPDLIELVSVSFDPAWSFFVDAGTVDNAAGKVTDMSFNIFGTMQGSFAIATIDFRAKAAGNAGIEVLDSDFFPFANMNAEVVPVGFQSTSVPIAAVVPEPATWAMLLGGFALLACARRRVAPKP